MGIGLKIKQLADEKKLSIPVLAKRVGKTKQSVYDIIDKEDINTSLLRKFAEVFNVPMSYFFDEGKEFPDYKIESTNSGPSSTTDEGIPLLPVSAMGGTLTGIAADSTLLRDCERIISPIKDADYAISVYGESMAPEYPSGSKVLIKRIDPSAFIDWGHTYVLDTRNGVILKQILYCDKEGCITCHSINEDPKYADFDVSMKDIFGIYRVLMCLSAK